jgi:alpha-L-rhamnosidase
LPDVHDLLVDGRRDPLGVDELRPRFSWTPPAGACQTGFELEVAVDEGFATPVWAPGPRDGAEPFGIDYDGADLVSRTRYFWRVRIRDERGVWSTWSPTAWFETGLLSPKDWSATWISDGAETRRRRAPKQALYFRTEMTLTAPVVMARAYVSALGWYRLHINEQNVTGHSLVPRWTALDEEVEYQVYEVTDALAEGVNVVGMVVADGRYRGRLGYIGRRAVYGTRLAALVQLEIELADGTRRTVTTDESWLVGAGRIRSADPMHGERVDLRVDDEAWRRPGGTPQDAQPAVQHVPHQQRRLIAETVDRLCAVGTRAGTVTRAPSGAQIVDFGQNFSGTARIRLPAAAGSVVALCYGEVLTPDGELNTTYLSERRPREWFQRDEVVLGDEPHTYTASFSIRGFRYLAVTGLATDLASHDVEAIEMSTPMRPTGEFNCSDPRLERLWLNARWSMVSNYLDTATDCPTRERSGWTGDAQVFGPTAATLFDVRAFDRRYLHNVAVEQHPDGRIPPYVPSEVSELLQRNPKQRWTLSSAGWSDVTVLLPWTLYTYYGDPDVLRRQYGSAKAWVDHLARRARRRGLRPRGGRRVGELERYIVDTGFHFGEWLRPGESGLKTQLKNLVQVPAVVATAYFAHSAAVLARSALVLGHDTDAQTYAQLAAQVRQAWRAAFVRDGGARIGDDRQDDYVRAIALDLLDEQTTRAAAAHRLVELIEAGGGHLDTGFLSTPLILPALCSVGRAGVAYRLLMQDTAPSWLYQVRIGATTIWESWTGNDADGNADQSQNHYALGSVASFLHEYVAGMRPAEPGWRRITIEPFIGGGLAHATSRVLTPYGPAESSWRLVDDRIYLHVVVPAGATATARVGDADWVSIGAGEHDLTFPTPRSEPGRH